MATQGFIEIPVEGRAGVGVPSQYDEKTPLWCYKNVEWCLTFYNRRANNLQNTVLAGGPMVNTAYATWLPPVQHMQRMMLYYLGIQPNMDYAFINDDLSQTTMQSLWINNQSVKEFVDYFKGNFMTRLDNVNWTGKPLSERATSERTNAWNKFMMAYDLKPYLKQMAEQFGAEINSGQQQFELPQHVKEFMEKDWKEYGADLCADIANGIWFSEHWWEKALQAFMNIVITTHGAMHFYTLNGRSKQEIVQPNELIFDNRATSDYGRDDQFVGRIKCYPIDELFTRYPELTATQRQKIEQTANSDTLRNLYNVTNNLLWWSGTEKRGTVAVVEMYWRTKNKSGKRFVTNEKGFEKIAKVDEDGAGEIIYNDVYQTTVIGNLYAGRMKYIDNLMEDFTDPAHPVLPIVRFRPNTFMGESISEVSRIHKIVDEIDYLDYKIREMVGKAKGKIYWINGEKFDESQGFKGFLENINAMGIHVGMPSGEDEPDRKAVELIDWTLDPNIDKLWNLTKEKEERMKKILSTSDISMGQQEIYTGYKTTQSTIAQNSLGTAYLFKGTLEWLVLCMRYAANVQKNLFAASDSLEASIVVGDRGVVQLKLWEGITFEQLYVQLNINEQMDEAQKKRIVDIALASAQNSQISLLDYLEIESANSVSQAKDLMRYSLKEAELKQQKAAAQQQQGVMQEIQAKGEMEVAKQQLSDDNENYRTQMQVLTKNVELLTRLIAQGGPPPSPLQQSLAAQDQQQQAPPMQ